MSNTEVDSRGKHWSWLLRGRTSAGCEEAEVQQRIVTLLWSFSDKRRQQNNGYITLIKIKHFENQSTLPSLPVLYQQVLRWGLPRPVRERRKLPPGGAVRKRIVFLWENKNEIRPGYSTVGLANLPPLVPNPALCLNLLCLFVCLFIALLLYFHWGIIDILVSRVQHNDLLFAQRHAHCNESRHHLSPHTVTEFARRTRRPTLLATLRHVT